jgi:hypothetical protein
LFIPAEHAATIAAAGFGRLPICSTQLPQAASHRYQSIDHTMVSLRASQDFDVIAF